MLEVHDIETRYGASQVLFGVSLTVRDGEVVSLLGRNGMGKTTVVRSIMGLTPVDRGRVVFDGAEIQRLPAYAIARSGIGLVPEGRQVFPNLSVHENLIATASVRDGTSDAWTVDRVYALFPALSERACNPGRQLSGGEQQMLAIGRALMTNPRLLILDEAAEGLAPMVRDTIWDCLQMLKGKGQSILVIDKDLAALQRIADRLYIMEKGRIVWSGTSGPLRADPRLATRYLGV